VETAYDYWSKDVGGRSEVPAAFVDEIMLAFMFPAHVGGSEDAEYFEQAICFPRARIPPSWLEYAEQGAIRLQTLGNDSYRLWRPYHFLMK
jgi:hypothetical protein